MACAPEPTVAKTVNDIRAADIFLCAGQHSTSSTAQQHSTSSSSTSQAGSTSSSINGQRFAGGAAAMAAPQPAQPATPAVFAVGEMVSVKRVKSASWQFARILAAPADKPDNPEHQGRYQVQVLATDQTYFVRPSAIREFAKPPSRVLVAETTQHYRSAAFTYAHPDDTALEVGCHEGVTTDILHTRCRWVLGIDKSWDPVARARARYPHCRFEQVDGFDTAALRRLSPSGGWDKIYIDIGGIAELPIVMSLVGLYYRTFPKSTLIVKSKFMKALLGNCQVYVPSQELQQRQQKQEQQQTKKERKQLRKQQHQQHQQECYQRHKQQQQQQQQQQRRQQEQDEQQQQLEQQKAVQQQQQQQDG